MDIKRWRELHEHIISRDQKILGDVSRRVASRLEHLRERREVLSLGETRSRV
jgi:hypothetical protein